MMSNDPETYAIIGAAMEVHKRLGHGFLEAVYQEALAIEFEVAGVPFKREVPMEVRYRDQVLECSYQADFVCFDEIIVELKAVGVLDSAHQAQLINYLKATGFHRGLLINFGAPRMEFKRFVWGKDLSTDDAD